MAAVTAGIIAGAGLAMNAYGQMAQGRSQQIAANYDAMVSERNADLAKRKALEDEKQFRLAIRKERGANVARLGASGVRTEGSPLEVLRENARNAERDAIAIRVGGEIQRQRFLSDAEFSRRTGERASSAANFGATSQVLFGTGSLLTRYS